MHELPLITTIAAAFTAAWFFGLITQRLGLSPIVGYLLAGVVIGPHTPGFVGDVHLAQQLAEVGIILLMFGVGLHFHVKDLLAVKGVAIPGAIGQSLVATIVAVLVFSALGVPPKTGMLLGMAMAVASTVVLMRVLMDADRLSSTEGHVAVGWLLVEDVFTVILLVLLPVLAGEGLEREGAGLWWSLGLTMLKLGALVLVITLAGWRLIPWVLVQVTRFRSRELFTLTVLVFSIAVAAGAYAFFGTSMALGAFLAGMVVGQSPVSHQAAADALPMRDAFAVLFFVSVGMLCDPAFVLQEPLMILAALGVILIAKPVAALLIVTILGYSFRTALTVAIGLAQIGEFSFILSEVGRKYGLMPDAGHHVLVLAAIISITINPLLFRSIDSIEVWLRRGTRLGAWLSRRTEARARGVNAAMSETAADRSSGGANRAIVVGYGPVGQSADRLLREAGLVTVVVDLNSDTVAGLKQAGRLAVYGDGSSSSILEDAGATEASHLIVTLPHTLQGAAVVAAGRQLNPRLRILVRARYLREAEDLKQAGATAIVFEEAEAASALARLVLADAVRHADARRSAPEDRPGR